MKLLLLCALVAFCTAQRQVASVTYPSCLTAVGGEPCVKTVELSPRDGFGGLFGSVTLFPIPCSPSADESSLVASDYRGYTVRNATDLSATVSNDLICSSTTLSRHQFGGKALFSTVSRAIGNGIDGATCYCNSGVGECRTRVIEFNSSSGAVWRTTVPLTAAGGTRNIWQVDSDVIAAPLVWIRDCNGTYPFVWSPNPLGPNAIVAFTTGIPQNCPLEFTNTWFGWFKEAGYQSALRMNAAASNSPGAVSVDDLSDFLDLAIHPTDAQRVQAELDAGHDLSLSFGPSYLSNETVPGDQAHGFATIDGTTGVLTDDRSVFSTTDGFIVESDYGGSSTTVWAVKVDNLVHKVAKIDMSAPANPVIDIMIGAPPPQVILNVTECGILGPGFVLFNGNGFFPMGCRSYKAGNSFEWGLSVSSESLAHAFFQEGGSSYAVIGYESSRVCAGCTFFGGTKDASNRNYDVWDTTAATPVLVDRFVNAQNEVGALKFFTYSNGFLFYTNDTDQANRHYYQAVDSTGFAGVVSIWEDVDVGTDAVIYERRVFGPNQILVNYGKYGSMIYDIDATGFAGTKIAIPSGYDAAAEASSGNTISCGNGMLVVNNGLTAAAGSLAGLYDSVELQVWDPLGVPASSTSTTSSSSTSTSTSTTSSTSTPTTASTGQPSSSTSTSTSTSTSSSSSTGNSCFSPDLCKQSCIVVKPSKLPDPTKIPDPTKFPDPSKVPAPQFYTIELTYPAASAADCDPDCCTVNDYVPDNQAGKWALCDDTSADNRKPVFNDKDATCTMFIFGQEGTQSFQLSDADFTAAQDFITTSCPSCEFTAKDGQSAKVIYGGGAVVAASLAIVALLAMLIA